jgi:curved DNA-binding protein
VIHGAYRSLALKYHPDRDGTQYATRRMADLNQAYALVREPRDRARYDAARRHAQPTVVHGSGGAPMPPPRSMAAGPG